MVAGKSVVVVTEPGRIDPHRGAHQLRFATRPMDVADQRGQTTTWALEGGSVGELTRGGWTEESIEVGDDITVRCRATKDGTAGCLLGYVTSINGTEMYKEFD